MTAGLAPLIHPRSGPARRVLYPLIIALAATLLAGSLAAAQDATATPTQQDLQQLRDEAIANGDQQLELTFEEYNDSGVEGTATLYDLGDNRTLVAIAVTGGGKAHPAHIHQGTCGNSEPEPYKTLTTVDETGASLSLVDVSLTDLIDGGDYTVDLHLSPSELGTLVVCTNIEGTTATATPAAGATAPATATVAPTGEGGQAQTPTATTAATATATATIAPTGEGGQAAQTPTATATATPAGGKGQPVDGTGGAQAAPGAVASLPLTDVSGLGVTGTVSLVAVDASTTKVTITLEGDAVTGGHIAHLHPGTCDDLQDEGTIYLATVGADGVSTTTVDIPLENLLNDGWSVNVHRSEADWDTWLACGYLGDATGGMTGSTSVTPATGGKGEPVVNVVTAADGTSGVGGKGEPVAPTSITQSVGVGSALAWPDSPTQAFAWSLAIFALLLAVAGIALRRADHRQPTRWHRLGL